MGGQRIGDCIFYTDIAMILNHYWKIRHLCKQGCLFCTLFSGKTLYTGKENTMKTVNGVYTYAKIFTDHTEPYALAQIQRLCDNMAFQDCRIRIMPDVHPGKVGTIGFTSTLGKQVLPNVIGIDIGCGITVAKLKQRKIEYQRLDTVIREEIPSRSRIYKNPHRFSSRANLEELRCGKAIQKERIRCSIGTLGGGNHFIEMDRDEEGNLYVTIHSGSRHLGKEVTEYYLREGQKRLKEDGAKVPYEMTYLEGEVMEDYIHDLQIVQDFAELNRETMLDVLVKGMKWKVQKVWSSVHNYIDISGGEPVIRKGAVSAKKQENVIIPINMRDGILIGEGLGNPDWNQSAPHGAGRIFKREDVRQKYTVSQFKAEMQGIYCSCIGKETLDEAPFAYRGIEEIKEAVADTVKIRKILKPVYNFKAGSRDS